MQYKTCTLRTRSTRVEAHLAQQHVLQTYRPGHGSHAAGAAQNRQVQGRNLPNNIAENHQ